MLILAVAPAADAQSEEPAQPFQQGMVLGLFHEDPDISYEQDLDEIVSLGCNSVSLAITIFQDDYDSSFLYAKTGRTAPDFRIRETILEAKKRDLRVMMFPIVLLAAPSDGKWRGAIEPDAHEPQNASAAKRAPEDLAAWWQSYRHHILRYAEIAEACGADAFSVGSELASMEKHVSQWRDLIDEARDRFSGELTYIANWDHREIPYWDDLDFLSISSYFEIADTTEPTLEGLTAAWQPIQKEIAEWHARVANGKPLVFAEVGYPSIDGAAMWPWDYTREAPIDLEEQALCYRAFRKAWRDVPYVGGVYFYCWFEEGGPDSWHYTPRNKPAELVLREWFDDE